MRTKGRMSNVEHPTLNVERGTRFGSFPADPVQRSAFVVRRTTLRLFALPRCSVCLWGGKIVSLLVFGWLRAGVGRGAGPGLVPVPEKVRWTNDRFSLSAATPVVPDEVAAADVAGYLAEEIHQQTGLAGLRVLPPSGRSQAPSVRLRLRGASRRLGAEGYELSVSRHGVVIRANAPAGLFYGVQTLLQLLSPEPPGAGSSTVAVPGVEITDRPRYPWRGMHLDVGRHFFPVEFVKKYIDLLARHKMNVFHWHLTEDQGWRIEIKGYPRLTEVGGWRIEADGRRYGGYYTQDEIREVVAYAARRFVTVVPEIELPGHALAALAAYPEYSCSGGPFTVPATWGIFEDVYCPGRDETLTFLEGVLQEVTGLFPGPWVHIGGDECPKDRWRACPRCQARIRQEGLRDEAELQSWFIRRIETFLTARGKRLVGWDEILEGGLPPRATVMSWRGSEGGLAAARAGHDVIMSPTSHCYFDYYQAREGEPPAIGGYLPLERVYAFEPTPPELTKKEARHILGGQGNVWTEYIAEPAYVEYMAVPRLCAMAEVLWSPSKNRDFAAFTRRMGDHYLRLDNQRVNFRIPTPGGFASRNVLTAAGESVHLTSPIPGAVIRYTLDGTDPTALSPRCTGPLHVTGQPPTELRARLEMPVAHPGPNQPAGRLGPLARGTFETRPFRESEPTGPTKRGVVWRFYRLDGAAGDDRLPPHPDAGGWVERFRMPEPAPSTDGLMVWSGYVEVPRDGVYTFTCAARGWNYLWIGDERVVANNTVGQALDQEGPIALGRGRHSITVLAVLRGGDFLRVSISGPGMPKQEIPAKRLKSEPEAAPGQKSNSD
jgi:hexosaminidase